MQTTLPFIDTGHSQFSFEAILYSRNERRFTIELNSRMKKSWRISKRGAVYVVSIPSYFDVAEVSVKELMIRWAEILVSAHLVRAKLPTALRAELSELERELWLFLRGDNESLHNRTVTAPEKRFRHTYGSKFDLRIQFDQLNDRYFNKQLTSFLRWGQHGSRTSYHTIISDEHKNKHHLITIAGLYNHPAVPDFALDGVLYHEMLHIACPPKPGALRRNVHHKDFRAHERNFHHYDEWQRWLQTDAAKLFRQIRRR